MAEISTELLYEVLKPIQRDTSELKAGVSELKHELNAVRGHLISMQQDIQNIYGILARHEMRLDRFEQRLELTDVPSL
jgi:hypothetical protein